MADTQKSNARWQAGEAAKLNGRHAEFSPKSPPMHALTLHAVKGEPRIDSRVLAQHLGNKHQNVRELLTDYADDFRELGILRFKTGEKQGRGQPERYALLNEDQAYLLLTYTRNTVRVRELKIRLVKAFRDARQAQDFTTTEYLPTYHAMHDEISALAGDTPNSRYVHINFNRLVNKAVGIEAGQRASLDIPHRALLVTAQYLASAALRGSADHREGYGHAKGALERLSTTLLEAGHHA